MLLIILVTLVTLDNLGFIIKKHPGLNRKNTSY